MAARAATRGASPSATSRPAAISTRVDAGLVQDDLLLDVGGWEAQLDRHHALAGRVLEVLEHALVAGVVGHDQAEAGGGVEDDAEAIDGELPAMVGERVDHDGG